MTKIKTDHKTFERNLDELVSTVLEARSYFDIWWIFINKKDRTKYGVTQLQYKYFFETCSFALVAAMIVSLYKPFEPRHDTVNIGSILRHGKDLSILDKNDITILNNLVTIARPIWGKIAILRSSIFAHKNLCLSREEIYKIAHVTANEIKELTERMLVLLNVILEKGGLKTRSFNPLVTETTYKLLERFQRSLTA